MRRLLLVVVAVSMAAATAWAADDVDTQNAIVGGTIPELCQIGIVGDLSGLLNLTQDGTGEIAYDAGLIASAADGTVLTLDANKKWSLGCKYNAEWTCPGAYNKAESDLKVQITNTPTGTIENSFDSYQSVTGANVVMLDHTAGVSNDVVNIQTEVLLDWTKDIPGSYSITIVYTMQTTP